MGQNFGVIAMISESSITLKELIQDTTGSWSERTSNSAAAGRRGEEEMMRPQLLLVRTAALWAIAAGCWPARPVAWLKTAPKNSANAPAAGPLLAGNGEAPGQNAIEGLDVSTEAARSSSSSS